MSVVGYKIAEQYTNGSIKAWTESTKPGIAKQEFDLLNDNGTFYNFKGYGAKPTNTSRKMFLYRLVRKVLGRDIPNIPQETGDCVSQGAKHATETLTCTQTVGVAAVSAKPEEVYTSARLKWRPIFAPYYYGTSRLYIGNGQMGRQAGSLGSWMAAALKFGSLFEDEAGVPRYSGQLADQWGSNRKFIDQWKDTADDYIVRTTARITTWAQYCDAICAGYPVTMASDIGYSMEPGRDGFHKQVARWSHQMMGFGAHEPDDYGLIMNSWGDVHGHLKDFDDPTEDLPIGVLRVHRNDIEKHLESGECYAFSNFDGMPDQHEILNRELFNLL